MSKRNKDWENCNDFVNIGINNKDGLRGEIRLSMVTDDDDNSVWGMPFGYIRAGKYIYNEDFRHYYVTCIWAADGHVVFLRKKKEAIK